MDAMTTAKTIVAEALFPMLSAFHSITGHPLRAVWQFHTEGSLDRLVFDFGSNALVVSADENDDSIEFSVSVDTDSRKAGGVSASHLEPWDSVIGASFGWGWVTVNQQGYSDGLLISFEGVVPQIVLNVIASSIKVGRITAIA
jgi:hypothetical protein